MDKSSRLPVWRQATGGVNIALVNSSDNPVVFSTANGYLPQRPGSYTPVAAHTTNFVGLDVTTNNYWYDLTVTAGTDGFFARRFAGRVETNAAPAQGVNGNSIATVVPTGSRGGGGVRRLAKSPLCGGARD